MGVIQKLRDGFGSIFKKSLRSQKKTLVGPKLDIALIQKNRGRKIPTIRQIKNIGRVLSPIEKKILQISTVFLIGGIVWLGFNIVTNYRVQVPKVGGKYIEAVVGNPQSVNPLFANLNDVDIDITRLVFAGLMRYDENQELVPDLAERYEISEDKKTYTFTLKENATWHDGEPVSARDVLFTMETIQNPQVASPLHVTFQGVQVSAPDDRTIVFVLQEPFNPFLSSLTVGIIPEHIWFDVTPENMRLHARNLSPVGSGPFKFKKLVKEETGRIVKYELERYADYYEEPAYISEFTFQFFSDYDGMTGAIQAFREQKVNGLRFVPADLTEKVKRKHTVLHTLELPQYTALFINQQKKGVLSEKSTREALEFGIDKSRLLQEVLDGEGRIIASPVLTGFPGYNADIEAQKYNIDKANEMLDQNWQKITVDEYRMLRKETLLEEWKKANVPAAPVASNTTTSTSSTIVQEDPVETQEVIEQRIAEQLDSEINDAQAFYRKNKAGDILTFAMVTADTPEYRKAGQIIAGYWQELGVKVDVRYVPTRDMARQILRDDSYDVLLYGVLVGSDPDQYPFWHSSQKTYPGLNLSNYENKDVDALLKKTRESTDESEIADLYNQFQEKIAADIPAIFLYQPTYTYATDDIVRGIDANKIAHPADRFADVNTWYVVTKGAWKN